MTAYDERDRLVKMVVTGSVYVPTFKYDSFGRRVSKTVSGVQTGYLYDGINIAQEKSGSAVTANLITGLAPDEWYARELSSNIRYPLSDALGSVVALTDTTQTIKTSYGYDAYGGTVRTGAADTNSQQYTGRENDGGLYYYRARYYSPKFGRFISEDPLGWESGLTNEYAYVGGNPLLYSDPTGECPWCVAAGIGALTDLAIQLYSNGFSLKCVDWKEVAISGAAAGLGVGIAQKLGKVSTVFGGQNRPTYRFFQSKGNVRMESHPISRNAPDWYSYPHWHPDFAGKPWSKMHWPLIEPMVGVPAAAYNAAKDDCECQK